MPFISVIIPTYNRAGWLEHAIDSVLSQTFKDWELIVVDDGSTDETTELLSHYGSASRSISLSRNQGVSAARNTGIRNSDSPWVAFLDSDDQWLPQKLEKQVRYLQRYPQSQILFTDEIWIRHGRRVNPGKKHRKQEGWIFQPSLSLCLMAPSTTMIRRNVFETTGLFDESLPLCEDYDLWLRVAARFPVNLLDEKLMVRYGGHSDQLSSRSWGNDRYRVQSLQKIIRTVPLIPRDREAALEKLIEKCEILKQGFKKRGKLEEAAYYQHLIEAFL